MAQEQLIRQSDPSFLTKKQPRNVRILDPEISISPGSGNLKAKGGLTPIHTSDSIRRIEQGGGSCENVRAGSSDRMSKSQRKGRPESHLTNRGVGVRWGLAPRISRGARAISPRRLTLLKPNAIIGIPQTLLNAFALRLYPTRHT
jgi:hypothetical protein